MLVLENPIRGQPREPTVVGAEIRLDPLVTLFLCEEVHRVSRIWVILSAQISVAGSDSMQTMLRTRSGCAAHS